MKPGLLRFMLALATLSLISGPSVAAQTGGSPNGITVQGEGFAAAPAESAFVYITIGVDSTANNGPVGDATPESTPNTLDVTGIIDAILAHGIEQGDIVTLSTPFYGEWSSDMTQDPVMLMVTVNAPTVDGLRSLLADVREAAHARGLLINQFNVVYAVSDCRALRQEARASAVADARENASDQAAAMQATVGEIIASVDAYPMNTVSYQSNTCMVVGGTEPYDMRYMAAGFDDGMPAEVTVVIAVQVTFSMP